MCVSLSTIAATGTLSLMTAHHLSNARFVEMIVERVSVRIYKNNEKVR